MNPSGPGSARLSSIDRWDTASRTFALGDTLRRLGYFTRQGENDAMALIPGHPAAIGTVRKMADTTRNGRFIPVHGEPQGVVVRSGAYENFHVETQKAAQFLARLTGRWQSDSFVFLRKASAWPSSCTRDGPMLSVSAAALAVRRCRRALHTR
jgi:hypothetical protein